MMCSKSLYEGGEEKKICMGRVGEGRGKKMYALEIPYLIWSWAKDKKVKGDRRHHVDKEPAFEVMDGYLGRMADHFFFFFF